MKLAPLCEPITLFLSDVDGVLTDGGLIFDNQGIETKRFHVRDGLGIKLWQRAGFQFGLITARSSHIVKMRSAELGIDILRQGTEDKLAVVQALLKERGLTPEQVAYIGDDLPDLRAMQAVGLPIAVADAAPENIRVAKLVTQRNGGSGAVREAIETILRTKGRWDELVAKFQ